MPIDKKTLYKQFQKEWKQHYDLKLFQETGWLRKQCRKCGHFFWSVDRKRKLCGDSSCEPYSFIGKKVSKLKLDYVDTWREFAKYFQKQGYTIIPRYPTIARWRDDTWFVQASIYNFQPYVVSGEVKPPANPLIVAQPCFRFNDIENIGITSRHNSGFVMIGQHRFMSSKLGHVEHWKDQDIANAIGVLEHLGINKKEITFVENVWMGGGNAGPCFEGFVRGLEIATYVFMQFALTDDGLKELPLKVIDIGWGLERLAWLLNGTPTVYEVAYDPVDKKWLKQLKIKFDSRLISKFPNFAASLNLEDTKDIDAEFKKVAKKINMPFDKFKIELEKMRAFYSILDHTRTLLFALADGALPSNTGGGYNLRFILRRALRLAEKQGWQIDFKDMVRDHARALSGARPRQVSDVRGNELAEVGLQPMYPELMDMLPNVEKILEIEIKKYEETKQKVQVIVDGLFVKKKKIDTNELIALYDSNGVLPEDVQAAAEKKGIKFEIPQDFYSRVASLHTENKREHAKVNAKLLSALTGLPATHPLYYDNEYVFEFNAKILKVIDGHYVILDKTAFYPTGGGQLCDLGEINGEDVVNVEKFGKVIIHDLPGANLKEGHMIIGKINSQRRLALIRHHDATHILNGIAHSVLGHHVWQAGSEVAPDKARLDLTHYSNLTKEELQKIEKMANETVLSAVQIKKTIVPKAQAEKQYGFKLYQGGAVPGADIRVVDVTGVDVEACGGTHGNNTSSVGYIKIIGSRKIQDGIIRLEFVAGQRAVDELQKTEKQLSDSAFVFNVPPEQLQKTCERFFREWKEQRKEIEKLKAEKAQMKPAGQQKQEQKK